MGPRRTQMYFPTPANKRLRKKRPGHLSDYLSFIIRSADRNTRHVYFTSFQQVLSADTTSQGQSEEPREAQLWKMHIASSLSFSRSPRELDEVKFNVITKVYFEWPRQILLIQIHPHQPWQTEMRMRPIAFPSHSRKHLSNASYMLSAKPNDE